MEWTKNNLPDHLKFYCGYARYAQFGRHEHVVVCCLDDIEHLRDSVEDLDGQDDNALCGANYILEAVEDGVAFLGTDKNPVEAMKKAIDKFLKFKASESFEDMKTHILNHIDDGPVFRIIRRSIDYYKMLIPEKLNKFLENNNLELKNLEHDMLMRYYTIDIKCKEEQ